MTRRKFGTCVRRRDNNYAASSVSGLPIDDAESESRITVSFAGVGQNAEYFCYPLFEWCGDRRVGLMVLSSKASSGTAHSILILQPGLSVRENVSVHSNATDGALCLALGAAIPFPYTISGASRQQSGMISPGYSFRAGLPKSHTELLWAEILI